MTDTRAIDAVAELARPGGALDLGRDQARLLGRMLRLLAQGRPLTREDALDRTADLGIDPDQVRALLDAWTERDDDGLIIGLGVTHNPTAHRMTIDGARMWAWCGMDTLIFAHVLQTTIDIESTAPTGDTVRLTASPAGVTGVDPVSAVVTQRVPAGDEIDFSTKTAIWGSFCHHNLFFPDRAQAEQWAAGRDDIAIMSIEDGFTAARHMAEALSRYDFEESR